MKNNFGVCALVLALAIHWACSGKNNPSNPDAASSAPGFTPTPTLTPNPSLGGSTATPSPGLTPALTGTPSATGTPTLPVTSTPTPSATSTPTLTSTPTWTLTSTPTSTSTACSGLAGSFGDGTGGTTIQVANQTLAFPAIVPVTGQVFAIELHQANGGEVQLGVYSDNGLQTAPASLLAYSSLQPCPVGQPTDMTLSLNLNLPVAAGQPIWLAIACVGFVGFDAQSVAPSGACVSSLHQYLPDPFTVSSDSTGIPMLLADYCH